MPIISHKLHIANRTIFRNGKPILTENVDSVDDAYKLLGFNYPKFFKMDILSKWAWIASECLLKDGDEQLDNGIDKTRIGLVLMTAQGCIDIDKKYQDSISEIPSPGLFVYTLPNIMLGEICIRHGYKGEQLCLLNDSFNEYELNFWASDLLYNRGMVACIAGWINIQNDKEDVVLYWLTPKK